MAGKDEYDGKITLHREPSAGTKALYDSQAPIHTVGA